MTVSRTTAACACLVLPLLQWPAVAQGQPDDAVAAPPLPRPALFERGSWALAQYVSASVGDDQGELYLGHTGVGYFFLDGHSINVEAIYGGIDGAAGAEDAPAVGVELLARWHFLRNQDASLFVDAGAGLLWSDEVFPAGGTHQNFTPQAGLGLTARLSDTLHLLAGAKWHHISNANKSGAEQNPGYNAAMVYVGLLIPF